MENRKLIKIAFIGNGSLEVLNKFVFERDDIADSMPTIGEVVKNKNLILENGENVQLQCWTISLQERFSNLKRGLYKGANAVVVCFNPNYETPLKAAEYICREFKKNYLDEAQEKQPIFLIGSTDNYTNINVLFDARKLAKDENMVFVTDNKDLTKGLTEFVESKLKKINISDNPLKIKIRLSPQKAISVNFKKATRMLLIEAFDKGAKEYSFWSSTIEEVRKRAPIAQDITEQNALLTLQNFLKNPGGTNLRSYKYKVVSVLFGDAAQTDDEAKELIDRLIIGLDKLQLKSSQINTQASISLNRSTLFAGIDLDIDKVNKISLEEALRVGKMEYEKNNTISPDLDKRIPKNITDENALANLYLFLKNKDNSEFGIFKNKVVSALFKQEASTDEQIQKFISELIYKLEKIPNLLQKTMDLTEPRESEEKIKPKGYSGHENL